MQLHEQTQRFILLLIFYLFGPMLTLGIVGGIVVRKHPSHARTWERSLAQQTGLHWEIQSVEYRSPGFTRLHNVKIFDDTAQHPVFHAAQIDVRRITETHRKKIFPDISATTGTNPTGLTAWLAQSFPSLHSDNQFWQITVPSSTLDLGKYSSGESALLMQNMLRKLFARFDTLSEVPVQFVFEHIYVISEYSLKKPGDKPTDKADSFRFVQGNLYRTASEIRSDWSFQIKDVSEIDTQHLSFILSQNETMEIVFRTGTQPIPCDLAAVFCTPFQRFSGGGVQGEFIFSTRSGNNSQTMRLNNVVFWNVPLAPLVGSYTDFAVMGTIADLRFEQAVLGADGTYAIGRLRVQNGAVEKALFHRCVDNFQLTVKPEEALDLSTRMIPFTGCSIHFCLRPNGVDFWADQEWGTAFMYQVGDTMGAESKMLVSFPSQQRQRPVTYHELMSIFAPDGAPVVPLTPELQSIVPYIPMPFP